MTTRLFGNAETKLITGRLRNLLLSTKIPQQMEVRLQGTAGWVHLWRALKDIAIDYNMQSLVLDVNAPFFHEGYHARWGRELDGDSETPLWLVAIPMTMQGRSVGRLVVSGEPDHQPVWEKIAALVKVVDDFHDTVTTLASVPDHLTTPIAVPTIQGELDLESLRT